jgi:ABC-type amino acid transport substrate-binding protein
MLANTLRRLMGPLCASILVCAGVPAHVRAEPPAKRLVKRAKTALKGATTALKVLPLVASSALPLHNAAADTHSYTSAALSDMTTEERITKAPVVGVIGSAPYVMPSEDGPKGIMPSLFKEAANRAGICFDSKNAKVFASADEALSFLNQGDGHVLVTAWMSTPGRLDRADSTGPAMNVPTVYVSKTTSGQIMRAAMNIGLVAGGALLGTGALFTGLAYQRAKDERRKPLDKRQRRRLLNRMRQANNKEGEHREAAIEDLAAELTPQEVHFVRSQRFEKAEDQMAQKALAKSLKGSGGQIKELLDTWFDKSYFALTTFSTTGYGDITPITKLEKGATMALMFASPFVMSGLIGLTSQMWQPEMPKTAADLAGQSVAVIEGSAPYNQLVMAGGRPVKMKDVEQGLRLLAAGEVDGLMHDGPVVKHTLLDHPQGGIQMSEVFTQPIGWQLRKPDPAKPKEVIALQELRMTLNRQLAAMSIDGTTERITKRVQAGL